MPLGAVADGHIAASRRKGKPHLCVADNWNAQAYLNVMVKSSEMPGSEPRRQLISLGTVVLVVALFGILAASVWFAARAWMSVQGPPMPTTGYVAMTLGVVFSLLVGFALMTLLFYSSRHGYDEQVHDQSYPPDNHRD